MSVIRIEFCILGNNRSLPNEAGSGIIDRVLDARNYTATGTETIPANFIIPPPDATHAILIGMTGNTIVGFDITPTTVNSGKLVKLDGEYAIALKKGYKIALKEYT